MGIDEASIRVIVFDISEDSLTQYFIRITRESISLTRQEVGSWQYSPHEVRYSYSIYALRELVGCDKTDIHMWGDDWLYDAVGRRVQDGWL